MTPTTTWSPIIDGTAQGQPLTVTTHHDTITLQALWSDDDGPTIDIGGYQLTIADLGTITRTARAMLATLPTEAGVLTPHPTRATR